MNIINYFNDKNKKISNFKIEQLISILKNNTYKEYDGYIKTNDGQILGCIDKYYDLKAYDKLSLNKCYFLLNANKSKLNINIYNRKCSVCHLKCLELLQEDKINLK